uniref:Putative ribonuclease H-like domain-containing protein n=1 Tax=Tanacetum cinerariifolium TaxID=118510 RepID=A0A6L2P056_TANCI|nr:putative ribonuclease H-like domain-containing protein [Tanacetum cinerariifolium]
MTLIEAARTMLADSLLPIPFWAEAVNTACYVQNRVLVTKPHNKTPYELLYGRTPSICFMRPFGCLVTILNSLDSLGKFDGKVDEGFLVGYSVNSKAFRVFNSRTCIVQETLHVNFLKNKPNIVGSGPTWLFDIDSLTRTINYQPVTTGNQTNPSVGFQDQFDTEKVGEEIDQQYMLFPMRYFGSTNPQNNDGDAAFDGKEHDFDVKKPESEVSVSPSSSAQLRKQNDKTKKEAKGKNADGPLNAAASPTYGKSSFIDASQLHDDPDMPELKDITYSDDEDDVVADADFNNLETSITVSPFPTTRVHKDHPISQIIVITDDYSRFTWVFFLATKDETSPILKSFITGLENQLSLEVKVIRSDNGTEFKNSDLNQFCELKGIRREFSVPKTPQQNSIAERKNRTLIEAARTMLADSLLPIPFLAEAVNTACYVQNRVLVTKPQNKTPYELLHGRTPSTGPTWLFDIDSLTRTMNYQPVTAGNQSNPNADFQEEIDAEKAGEEATQQYMLFLVWSTSSLNPQNKEEDAAFDGKEYHAEKPESAVNLSPSSSARSGRQDDMTKKKDKGKSIIEYFIGNIDFNAYFEDYSEDISNNVSVAGPIVPTAGQNYSNITNPISAAGPSNTNTSPTHGKSLFQDASQMLKREDITYSDHENVGGEADFNNLETSITVNDVPRLQALVDKKKVVITKATVRDAPRLDDAEGVDCLPNEEIFAELARMGYEKPSIKLTFYKAFFSSYLVRNVYSTTKFYMYPHFLQLIIRKQVGDLSTHTTKYTSPVLTQKEIDAEGDANEHVEEVNTGDAAEGDNSATHGEVQQTPPQSPQGRMIAEMDQDDAVVLKDDKKENKEVADAVKDAEEAKVDESAQVQGRQAESQAEIYKIDIDHANKVLSMQEDETKPAEVQEVVDVVTTTKLIIEVVTAASETITAASAIITTAEAQILAATTATLTAAPARVAAAPSRRKGVIIRDPKEESTTSTIIPAETKSKDKGKRILVEEPKPLKKKQQI